MAVDPFEKKIYSLIAWKSLQEKPSFNPRANEVIANNVEIRKYLATHPPLRSDGIHPYIQCRRRCIYGVLPHPVPAYQKPLFDESSQRLSVTRPRLKVSLPLKSSPTCPERQVIATKPKPIFDRALEWDENHYCSVYSSKEFPLMGDSCKKGIFEYWKKFFYDEEISAQDELKKAWDKVLFIQRRIGARQDAELEKVLKQNDGTILETSLYSPVFYPWNWPWKPETPQETKRHSKKILLKFDIADLESLARKKEGSSISGTH